jgi:hypothetical protein
VTAVEEWLPAAALVGGKGYLVSGAAQQFDGADADFGHHLVYEAGYEKGCLFVLAHKMGRLLFLWQQK